MRCRRWDSGWSKGSGLAVNVAPESTTADVASAAAVRLAVPEDIPSLRAAAGEVFAASRFRAPWYDRADSGRFYATGSKSGAGYL